MRPQCSRLTHSLQGTQELEPVGGSGPRSASLLLPWPPGSCPAWPPPSPPPTTRIRQMNEFSLHAPSSKWGSDLGTYFQKRASLSRSRDLGFWVGVRRVGQNLSGRLGQSGTDLRHRKLAGSAVLSERSRGSPSAVGTSLLPVSSAAQGRTPVWPP